jgi:hypothetical protein
MAMILPQIESGALDLWAWRLHTEIESTALET